ncbi:PLP-dependent aminotransferase family protein [Trinickia dinghuensis]|uniref:PLP-dependent aminotransferase family protein n=1 Tax=Trinickia dinghuensis TaxID=2291023 RepID=A0A3D8JUF8_9BURK|nr:PLP-dependent aminotransferase family protein [Trinickia dinghuensis]RDU96733.1 PLP-dependent aminotransferase family protein [Trinickia dinghuensis]
MSQSVNAPPSAASTIHAQIYARFRAMIEQGQLKPGQRISSLRALAEELGVARGTVQAAYDRLLGEGYLIARGAAGTFVAEHTAPTKRLSQARTAEPAPRSAPSRAVRKHAGDAWFESAGQTPAMLQLGIPALDEFPRKLWTRLLARHVRQMHALNKPAPAGYAPLREALATYLYRSRGFEVQPAQVFIVPAYTAGLDLAVDALGLTVGLTAGPRRGADHGVWVECPGFPPTARLLKRVGLHSHLVPVDEQGLDVDFGLRHYPRAKMAVVTPSHQSPTGVALSLPRRVALLDWAAKHRAWIVEDDYDGEYRYRGHPLPALKSLDTRDRVIYSGTLSKVMFPGLRLAYVVAPQSQIEAFEAAGTRAAHGGCPELMQAAVAEFIADGHFARHIKRMRTLYAQRRAMLATALQPYEDDGYVVRLQDGGMHLMLDVPAGSDDLAMARRAREAGFGVHSLTAWRSGRRGQRALLLGFTNIPDQTEANRQVTLLMRALGDKRA